MIYGYCRISTKSQNIERQERNIIKAHPEAHIVKEVFTGTKIEGRKEFTKLLKTVKKGDTIIFDSVSRMSRDSEEGFNLYMDLFKKGVELKFIKESYINTEVYKSSFNMNINIGEEAKGDEVISLTLEYIANLIQVLAKRQIEEAFKQSEKEVTDLKQRTKEGLITAKLNGKELGTKKGSTLTTKKSIEAKDKIKKYIMDPNSTLNDLEIMKLVNLSRNTYYKYKKQLLEEIAEGGNHDKK